MDVGLVVTLYDILSITGGHIYPSDASPYFDVVFRLVIFRPFLGEVLVGKIKRCTRYAQETWWGTASIFACIRSRRVLLAFS